MGIKGTVLEVRGKRATVMTEHCEFKEVRLKKPVFPGEEIEFSLADVCGREHFLNKPLGRAIAAAACFVLVFFLGFAAYRYLLPPAAYAYVGLDINPSLELAVNKDWQVTDGRAFDPEGEAILQEADINGREISQAFSEIIELCGEKGYLQAGGVNHIAVSVCMAAPSWFAGKEADRDVTGRASRMEEREGMGAGVKREEAGAGEENSEVEPLPVEESAEKAVIEKVTSSLQAVLEKENVPAQLYVLSVNPAVRKEAQGKELSTARYFIWQESERTGVYLNLEEARRLKGEQLGRAAERLAAKVLSTGERKGRGVDTAAKGGAEGGPDRSERSNVGNGSLRGKNPEEAGARGGEETGEGKEAGKAMETGKVDEAGKVNETGKARKVKESGKERKENLFSTP